MIEEPATEYLKQVSRVYCRAERQTLSQASAKLYGHRDFLPKFHRGQVSITLRKYDELIQKFIDHWPEGVEWPAPPFLIK